MLLEEEDDRLIDAHSLLVRHGVIQRVARKRAEFDRWLAWELAAVVEGQFHRIVDTAALTVSERRHCERLVTDADYRPRSAPSNEFSRAYWLMLDGTRVGTLALEAIRFGRPDVGISSLYVLPEFRRRGIATRALDAVYSAVVDAGADGIRLETSWCWQPAVRYYLRRGFWLSSWKHALPFVRAHRLGSYRVDIDRAHARFSLKTSEDWTPWIEAENLGTALRWNELSTPTSADDSFAALQHYATCTFALHLAAHGWPLIRSPETWQRRHDWWDLGMPEGLALKIAVFEWVAREAGYDVRTPRIPGLDYDATMAAEIVPADDELA